MAPRTLIVQKDPELREAASASLRDAGHQLLFAETVGEARRALLEQPLEAMVSELEISLLRELRSQATTRGMAIVVLSRRTSEDDKVLALEAGADDYVTAPFSCRELAARIDSILRRRGHPQADGMLQVGVLRIDIAHYRVTARGRDVALSPTEFRLLHALVLRAGRAMSRAQLVDSLKASGASLGERSVDAQVNRLRRALAPFGCSQLIQTVSGVGYRVVIEVVL